VKSESLHEKHCGFSCRSNLGLFTPPDGTTSPYCWI
jgi:hypothetical protein